MIDIRAQRDQAVAAIAAGEQPLAALTALCGSQADALYYYSANLPRVTAGDECRCAGCNRPAEFSSQTEWTATADHHAGHNIIAITLWTALKAVVPFWGLLVRRGDWTKESKVGFSHRQLLCGACAQPVASRTAPAMLLRFLAPLFNGACVVAAVIGVGAVLLNWSRVSTSDQHWFKIGWLLLGAAAMGLALSHLTVPGLVRRVELTPLARRVGPLPFHLVSASLTPMRPDVHALRSGRGFASLSITILVLAMVGGGGWGLWRFSQSGNRNLTEKEAAEIDFNAKRRKAKAAAEAEREAEAAQQNPAP